MITRKKTIAGFLTWIATSFILTTTIVSAQMADDATVEKAGNDNLLWLAGITLLIGLGVGIWQLFKVRKAKRSNAHSSLAGLSGAKDGNGRP